MGRKHIDLTGQKFGTVTVLRLHGHMPVRWIGECSNCGSIKPYLANNLKRLQSCGCLKIELQSKSVTTHGQSHSNKTPEYGAWLSMRGRCLKPQHKSYHDYGGRGITVCERWMNSFENFFADMGKRPDGYSIERINNDGNYEPGNCKWIPRPHQSKNQRSNKQLEYNGKKRELYTILAKKFGRLDLLSYLVSRTR